MFDPTTTIQHLEYLCQTIPPQLEAMEEAAFAHKPAPDKWSPKEIIGHLIDSATNNHQRFVRAQFETEPHIVYDQNNWNTHSYYQQMPKAQVIGFWRAYNVHLVQLFRLIPAEHWNRVCRTNAPHPLSYILVDYVAHMEHHLRFLQEH